MEVEDWLTDAGIDEPWEYAPVLVQKGFDVDELETLLSEFSGDHLALIIDWLVAGMSIAELIHVIAEGTGRISSIVGALKMYSYVDQAPVQNVNIHDGLNNTLLMLNSKLKKGVSQCIVVMMKQCQPLLPLVVN